MAQPMSGWSGQNMGYGKIPWQGYGAGGMGPVYGRNAFGHMAGGDSGEFGRLLGQAEGAQPTIYQGQQAQQQAIDAYGKILAGEGPSVAEAQMQQGLGQAQTNAAALAGQTRGGNIASAEQAAMVAQTGASQGAVNDAAALRAGEQQAAMAGLAQTGGQLAGQGLEQQMGYEQLLSAGQLAQMDAQLQHQLGNRELDLKARQDRHGRIQNWVKTGSNVVGSILAAIFSDERVKRNVQPSNMQATAAIGSSDPIAFDYEPGFGPHGRQLGVTAQSLERTPAGAQVVRTDPQTGAKMVDVGGLTSLNTAGLAETIQRVDELEGKLDAGPSGPVAQVGHNRQLRHGGTPVVAAAPAIDQAQLASELRRARMARIGDVLAGVGGGQRGGSRFKPFSLGSAVSDDTGSALANLRAMRERNDRGIVDDKSGETGGMLSGLFSNIGGGG